MDSIPPARHSWVTQEEDEDLLPLMSQAQGMTPAELRHLGAAFAAARAAAPLRPPRTAVERGAGAAGVGPLGPVAAAGAAVARAGEAVAGSVAGALGLAH